VRPGKVLEKGGGPRLGAGQTRGGGGKRWRDGEERRGSGGGGRRGRGGGGNWGRGQKTISLFLWFRKSAQYRNRSLRTLKIMPRNLNEIVRS
jgi:hypothetical protein